jgi:hypothetical protein
MKIGPGTAVVFLVDLLKFVYTCTVTTNDIGNAGSPWWRHGVPLAASLRHLNTFTGQTDRAIYCHSLNKWSTELSSPPVGTEFLELWQRTDVACFKYFAIVHSLSLLPPPLYISVFIPNALVQIVTMSWIIRCVLMPSDAGVGVREAVSRSACGPLHPPPSPVCLLKVLFHRRQKINCCGFIKNGLYSIGWNSLISVCTGVHWDIAVWHSGLWNVHLVD